MARLFYIEDNEEIPAIAFEASAPTGFTLITDPIKLKALHATRYDENRHDGINYYNEFQAGLYLDLMNGTYTVPEVVTLEAYVATLGDGIKAGAWLTAQQILSNLALSGIFDQVMKDKIALDISSYISDNY